MKRNACLILGLWVIASGLCGCNKSGAGEATNARAWEFFSSGVYDTSLDLFTRVAKKSEPLGDEQLHALFGMANVWALRRPGQDEAKASALYDQIVKDAPEHDLAAWSLLGLARISHLTTQRVRSAPEETRAAYQRVIDRFPSHPAAEEAFIFQQSMLIASFKKEDSQRALMALKQFIETHPNSRFVSEAYGWLAAAHEVLGDPEHQLEASIIRFETSEIDAQSPRATNAISYWKFATLAEFQVGDFEVARKYYRLLIDEYPIEQRVFPAKQALARMDKIEAELRKQPSTAGGITPEKQRPTQ